MRAISLTYIRQRMQNAHPRTRKAQLNTALGLIIKGGGILISFLLVPLTIDYLSKETYGTWLTMSSIITMLAFFDIGIGNGPRNKLSEAVSNQDMFLARAYISTAYFIFGLLQSIFIIGFLFVFRYVPWQQVLNTSIDDKQLQTVVLITAIAVAIKLVLDILSYVLFALQESGKVSIINFLFNIFTLLGTYLLAIFTNGNLIYLATITALSPIVVLLLSGLILYRKKLKIYKPSIKFINIKYAKNLLSLGYKFFFIQIAVVILFYSDNLIITQLFGSSNVTTYNVAFRYFNAISTIFTIVTTPYWSAFTEASVEKDTKWMVKTYDNLKWMWVLLLAIVVIMFLLARPIYNVWIGSRVKVPTLLNFMMGLNVIIICWNSINVTVTNGLGKINLQLFCAIFASLINIPMAIFLGQSLNLGSSGVVLATCISLLPSSFIGAIQARKLINNSASGLWSS